jgi:hypothetical protein
MGWLLVDSQASALAFHGCSLHKVGLNMTHYVDLCACIQAQEHAAVGIEYPVHMHHSLVFELGGFCSCQLQLQTRLFADLGAYWMAA